MPNRASGIRNFILIGLFLVLGVVLGYKGREWQEMHGNFGPFMSSSSNANVKYTLTNTTQPTEFKNVDFSQFWEVWKILQDQYVDPSKIQTDQMVYGAIKGMTASLGDPYTMYLPPVEQKRIQEDIQGSFYGVGIELGYVDKTLAAIAPIKGSPAEKAGVKAKDLILHVKDEKKGIDKDTAGWSLEEAVDNIRGDKGTQVILTLLRSDDPDHKEPFTVTLTRDEIIVPSVELKYVNDNGKKIAQITLSKFGERTQTELDKAIADIHSQSPKVDGIILDLRNNPGGLLDEAVSVASEFIPQGLIVRQQGKTQNQDYNSNGSGRLANYPVIVVVNGGSASASEIVAGALRDRKHAELVGEKSFGKGTVQNVLDLGGGAGLHVTVAKWLLPNGDWIHEQGIPVNVEVKDDPKTDQDEVLQKAQEELLKQL